MTVDASGDERITLEGLHKPYSFMDAEDPINDEEASETGSDDDESVGDGGTDLGVGATVTTAMKTTTASLICAR